MGSKSIRNLIIALIILAIGIRVVIYVFNNYLSRLGGSVGFATELVGAVESMGTLITYGIIVLIIIAIPFYLSKRSKKKEMGKEEKEKV